MNNFDFRSELIINNLSIKEKELLFSHTKQLLFKKGQLFFHEGSAPTGIYLMKEGTSKIMKTSLNGTEQIFYIYKKGDLIGYHALLCNEDYQDSCQAITDCEVLFISKVRFELLMQEIPHLKDEIMSNMAHEFGVLINKISILAQKSVRERLAFYLLILNDRFKENQEEFSNINLSREDLANLIGTARETVVRLLSEFKNDDYIEINKRIIKIKSVDKLVKCAKAELEIEA